MMYPQSAPKKSISSYQFLLLTIGVSLGLHGVLLWAPMGGGTAKVPEVKSEPITITQNPPAPRESADVAVTTDKTKANQKPGTKAKTASTSKSTASKSSISIAKRKSAANISIAKTKPASTATTGTSASTTRATPVVSIAKVNSQNNSNSSVPSVTGTVDSQVALATNVGRNPNPTVIAEFMQNLALLREPFPNYPGSVVGCAGIPFCYTVATDMTRVTNYLTQEFKARNYDLELETEESTRKVYKLSKDSQTQVLTVLSDNQQTLYVFGNTAYTAETLQKATQTFAEYQAVLSQGREGAVKPETFTSPSLFYVAASKEVQEAENGLKPHTLTEGNFWLSRDQSVDQTSSSLATNLQAQNFQVTPLTSGYGGGTLYEVTKDQSRFYLNLVPARDNQGTILVTWLQSPVSRPAKLNDRFLVIR